MALHINSKPDEINSCKIDNKQKFTQDEVDNLNSPINSQEMISVTKNPPKKEISRSSTSLGNSIKYLKKK
jgi:hypothetical protein